MIVVHALLTFALLTAEPNDSTAKDSAVQTDENAQKVEQQSWAHDELPPISLDLPWLKDGQKSQSSSATKDDKSGDQKTDAVERGGGEETRALTPSRRPAAAR